MHHSCNLPEDVPPRRFAPCVDAAGDDAKAGGRVKLILMRHAKAEPFVDEAGDFDRKLEPAGRRRAWATAQALAHLGLHPELALVSPSTRTMETWEVAQPVLGGQAEAPPALYHAAPAAIMAAVAEAASPDITLIVVGHNPGMHELALNLAQAGAAPPDAMRTLRDAFPTASAIVFDWSQKTDQPTFRALVVKGRTWTAD